MSLVRKLKTLAVIPQNFNAEAKDRESFVRNYLLEVIPYLNVDNYGNLYLINPDTPLICAHMDTVQSITEVAQVKKWNVTICMSSVERWSYNNKTTVYEKIMTAPWQVWFDDKCGIAIALQLYEELWDKVSLLFTCWEESWREGSRYFLEHHKDLLAQCLYCVVPDRRDGFDVIWYKNQYCSMEFQDDIMEFVWDFGFKPEHWVLSDCDTFNKVLNCVNLSCGYYNPHHSTDFISVDEFENSFEAIKHLVTNYRIRRAPYSYTHTPYQGYKNSRKKKKSGLEDWLFGWENGRGFYDDGHAWEYEDYDSKAKKKDKEWKAFMTEAERSSVEACNKLIKIDKKSREITFKEDMVFTKNSREKITIPKWEYRFFQDTVKGS